MAGHEVAVRWRERVVRAWIPALLTDADLHPRDRRAVQAAERARLSVLHADLNTPAGWEPLARLLLRAEGIASSYIEGVRAPVPDVALAQLGPGLAAPAADWVAANLAVLDLALDHATTDMALTLDTLNGWHAALMSGHSMLSAHLIGAVRDEQGWIGGTSPLDATLVTAPVDALPELLDDLLRYINGIEPDPITQAALAHAQFEIIHPYGDGNGRLGRILILWILARRTGVRVLPPISTRIAAEPGAYLAEITRYRLGAADGWVRWFADVITSAAARVGATMQALAELEQRWNRTLDTAGVRRDAAARRLLAELPRSPVLSSATAAQLATVSERSGRTALDTLARAGIVHPFISADERMLKAGRYRWWYAPDVITVLAGV